jgi:DNA-binding transcriptional ArsR family regulator
MLADIIDESRFTDTLAVMTETQPLLEVCKALANPTRLKIMGWLRDPAAHFQPQPLTFEDVGVCVKQIQEKAGISQSTASQFMAVLQRAGLVESTRVGQWTYYRRNASRIAQLAESFGRDL